MLLRVMFLFALLASLALHSAAADEPRAKEQPAKKTRLNRLARSSSPYLLQHAHNPVDWYPWGAEAFERAKKEKKLIFLSIGYSSCHWCHVMERESFSNAEIAKVMNDHFVCIKVDREERPDIDDIYMTALSVTGVQGGWPLTMILTPDGKPIFGGTYFPPEDRKVGEDAIPGLKSILARVIELDRKERPELEKQADHIAKLTNDALDRNTRVIALVNLDRDLVNGVAAAFEIDPEHGGTGSKARMFKGPKFPRPPVWQFLLTQSKLKGKDELAKQVRLTLHRMAEGGIYDHLGGGFHRYSTERTWTVPHFEKMLYDNAQLAELYSDAYAITPDPVYKRVVAETLDFIKREMTSPDGAFYSALDADSEHQEGEFYIWKPEEIRKVLGEADTKLFSQVYGDALNFEGKATIFRLPKPLAEIGERDEAERGRVNRETGTPEGEAAQGSRKAPAAVSRYESDRRLERRDDRGIRASGGGFQESGVPEGRNQRRGVHSHPDARQGRPAPACVRRGARREASRNGNRVPRRLLLLHPRIAEPPRRDRGTRSGSTPRRNSPTSRSNSMPMATKDGFYFTPSDGEKLFARAKDGYDGVQPSGNSQMARNLLRLAEKTGNQSYRELCQKTMKQFALTLRMNPGSVPAMALCLERYLASGGTTPKSSGKFHPPKKLKESADVVKAAMVLGKESDGRRKATVNLKIADGWHIYANPIGNETLLESQTAMTIQVNGTEVKVDLTYPKGKEYEDSSGDKYQIYEGEAILTAHFAAPPTAQIEARVKLIACKDGKCLLPSVLKVK